MPVVRRLPSASSRLPRAVTLTRPNGLRSRPGGPYQALPRGRSHGPRYEICVRGRLGETIRFAFPALQARTSGDATMLTGVLADQASGCRVKSRHRCDQVSVTTFGFG